MRLIKNEGNLLWWKIIYILVLFILIFLFRHIIGANANDMTVIKDKAIKIANEEAKQLGYDLEIMSVKATLYNTPWNEYLSKDSIDEYSVERRDKLKNRRYWAVYYYLDPEKVGTRYKGGDLCIFIDSTTGEIITDIRGK